MYLGYQHGQCRQRHLQTQGYVCCGHCVCYLFWVALQFQSGRVSNAWILCDHITVHRLPTCAWPHVEYMKRHLVDVGKNLISCQEKCYPFIVPDQLTSVVVYQMRGIGIRSYYMISVYSQWNFILIWFLHYLPVILWQCDIPMKNVSAGCFTRYYVTIFYIHICFVYIYIYTDYFYIITFPICYRIYIIILVSVSLLNFAIILAHRYL